MTNTADKTKIIERIKKLLSLADESKNPSESEVFNALNKARSLMAEYEISEDDVTVLNPEDSRTEWNFYSEWVPTTATTLQVWEEFLIIGIATITHTKPIRHRNPTGGRGYRLKLHGEENDVKMGIMLFSILKTHARRIAEECYQTRPDRRSYQEGFGLGVQKQANEKVKGLSAEQSNRYAIVSTEKSQWVAKCVKENMGETKDRSVKNNVNPFAFQHGFDDGNSTSLNNNQRALSG